MSSAHVTVISGGFRHTTRPPTPESRSAGTAAGKPSRRSTVVPTTRLRLTRRGRVVLTALLAAPLVFGIAAVALLPGQAAASAGTSVAGFQHVTISTGESLWQVAEKLAPNADPRDVVAAFVDLNQLPDTTVRPGERFAIPRQYAH